MSVILLGILILTIFVVILLAYYLFKGDNDEKIVSDIDINFNVKKKGLDKEIEIMQQEFSNIDIKDNSLLETKKQIHKKVIGQDNLINGILIGILANGHVLVEGVPGLAKTKTIATLSEVLDLMFRRIQFTPDMLPSDIIGTLIFNQKIGDFEVKKGPVFTNILLADEINRTTPKVQSALLEAMQERKVNIGGQDYKLPKPFFVLATQNPVEQEGTYPLPEAQLDRFLFKIVVNYPSPNEEKEVLNLLEKEKEIEINKVLSTEQLLSIQDDINKVYVSENIKEYIIRIINATREPDERIYLGVSPRGTIGLLISSKVISYLQGRDFVTKEDVLRSIFPTLRHRLILTYDAKMDGLKAEDVLVDKVLKVNL